MLNQAAKVAITHIPYKGGAPTAADVLGGQIPMLFASLGAIQQYLDGGQIRALAVLTKERYPRLPEVPAMSETYPGVEISGWTGIFGPAGMPADIVSKINASVQHALNMPKVASVLTTAGLTPTPGDTQMLADLVAKEVEQRTKIIQATGIQRE